MTAALGVMALAVAMIPWTAQTAPAVRGFLRDLPLKSEFAALTQFPSPVFLLSIAAAVWLLDVRRRVAVFYLVAALAASGLAVEALKQTLGRARPEAGVLMTEDYMSRLTRLSARNPVIAPPAEAAGRDTWLLFTPGRPVFEDAFSSFPSGHATSAFVVAAFLYALYPRGRWIWLLLAAGCALARIRARRHFLDDVLFSGGLGWLLTTWVFRWHWPARLGHKIALWSDSTRK